jgi:DNA-directed RNA polymerase subunit RPC12/RpoP
MLTTIRAITITTARMMRYSVVPCARLFVRGATALFNECTDCTSCLLMKAKMPSSRKLGKIEKLKFYAPESSAQ